MVSLPTMRNVFLSPAFLAAILLGIQDGGDRGGRKHRPPKKKDHTPPTRKFTEDLTNGKCNPAIPPADTSTAVQKFNAFRTANGLPSVTQPTVDGLQSTANEIGNASAEKQKPVLTDGLGNPLPVVLRNNGITDWTSAYGISVASCSTTVEELLTELEANPTTNAVIKNAKWTDVGINGYAPRGTDTKNYWVLIFVQNPTGPGAQPGSGGNPQIP